MLAELGLRFQNGSLSEWPVVDALSASAKNGFVKDSTDEALGEAAAMEGDICTTVSWASLRKASRDPEILLTISSARSHSTDVTASEETGKGLLF